MKLAVQRKEAAELLDVGVDTFDRHIRPHVPVVRVGGVRLYTVAGLEAWLQREADRGPMIGSSTKRPRDAQTSGGMAQGEVTP